MRWGDMRKLLIPAFALIAPLGACTTAYTSPVGVDRFVAADPAPLEMRGAIAVEAAPGQVPVAYLNAVSEELERLGYRPGAVGASDMTARVTVEMVPVDGGYRRSPVGVGVGGSTGSCGSGVGAGIGINLGGSEPPTRATRLAVSIRDVLGTAVWEGRAELLTGERSPYAADDAAAAALANALFEGFPGENGETFEVELER